MLFKTKTPKKTDLSDQSMTCKDPKKIKEDKISTGSSTDMADDVSVESLKLLESVEILFNCLRNVERLTKDIYALAHSTRDYEIKAKSSELISQNPKTSCQINLRSVKKTEQRKIR